MIYDLHVHTTASDGTYTPAQILDLAIKSNLTGLAITDHDTVDGIEPALNYLKQQQYDLVFIPGIEMNTEDWGEEIHILGYYINHTQKDLLERLQEIRQERRSRAYKMVERLQNLDIYIEYERVAALAKGELIGRPHIARALIEKDYAANIKDAFEKYIGRGKAAYVPRYKFQPREAIELIHQAGGVAVLAHPGLLIRTKHIEEIIKMGIEGLEVFYPEHKPEQINIFMNLCHENNLFITGGSDFHGYDSPENRGLLGSSGISQEALNNIKNLIKK